MLTSLLLAGLLASTGPIAPSSRLPSAAPPADPCPGAAAPAEEPDWSCGDLPACSRQERVRVACELRDALEARYVFFGVKGRLLQGQGSKFDARRHLDACVAAERAVAREPDALRFYDRMRRCTAAFEDGHLLMGVPAGLPEVALGVGLRLAEGRVFVASQEARLVAHLEAEGIASPAAALLATGNEVLAVDGRPVGEALAALARLVPGSSAAARMERAVDALTRRDFAFPEHRTASLTIAVDGVARVVELPWWISPDAGRHPAAREYLRRSGLPTTDLLPWRGGAATAVSTSGALRSDPIVSAQDATSLRVYRKEQGAVALRAGEVVLGDERAFCYLQALTFHTETLDGPEGRRPFQAVVEGFVRSCREKALDLVVDLRQNEGGYLSHSTALAALLAPPGGEVPAGALLLKASARNRQVYEQRAPRGAPVRPDDPLDPARIAGAIDAALREHHEFTPAFLEPPLRPAQQGGYPGRVLALVSPGCMSACDRLAGMLRESGRAVLVGTPTEGAGGSQQETKDLGARWSDRGGLLSLSIPNAAMGIQQGVSHARAVEASSDEFFRALAIENRPVEPDVVYATRREDLVAENRGWLERVEAVLFGADGEDAGAADR